MQVIHYGTDTIAYGAGAYESDYRTGAYETGASRSSRHKKRHSAKRGHMTLKTALILLVMAALLLFAGRILTELGLFSGSAIPEKYYSASDFGIETLYSPMDFNANGVDDYSDIVLGARAEIGRSPKYDGSYHIGGYPPEDIGVCTDVVWRSFAYAGYSLKDMVDADIALHTDLYPAVKGSPDTNIDFRRVPNLKVFFERYGQSLTLDPTDYAQWQPGDIVTYGDSHIAIVSDRRNADGRAYILHNGGKAKEADELANDEISGHYRFDASRIKASALIPTC